MIVYGVLCLKCNTYVFSRAHHDCRNCPCGNCMVDGGNGKGSHYMRTSMNKHSRLEWVEIKQTEKQLYNDWDKGKDKYGYIPKDKAIYTINPDIKADAVKRELNQKKTVNKGLKKKEK